MPATLTPNQIKWVEALESGEFKQTRDRLCNVDDEGKLAHCCLGVAAEVAIADGVKIDRRVVDRIDSRYVSFDGACGLLTAPVMKWLGLNPGGSVWIGLDTATYLNDNLGLTFDQIAAQARREGIH